MSMQFDASISKRNFGFDTDDTLPGFSSCNVALLRGGFTRLHPLAVMPCVDPNHIFEADLFDALKLWW